MFVLLCELRMCPRELRDEVFNLLAIFVLLDDTRDQKNPNSTDQD